MIPSALLCLAFLALHRLLFAGITGPPIGDELEYLERARSRDPLAPRQFLRVPGMGLLAAAVGGRKAPEPRLRRLSLLASVFAVGATAWLAAEVLGPAAALGAGLLMVLLPERLLLAHRIWPDNFLAAVACLLLWSLAAAPPTAEWALVAGALCAVALLLRFDGLTWAPATALALALDPAATSPLTVACLALLPSVATLVWLSLRNRRRYGTFLPDDTVLFNLQLAASPPEPGGYASTITRAYTTWIGSTPGQRWARLRDSLTAALAAPLRPLRGLGLRTIGLLGADSFSTQVVLPASASRPIGAPLRKLLALSLFLGTPVLIAWIATLQFVGGPWLPLWLLPTLVHAATMVAFHFRTRYRLCLLPGLALWAAGLTIRAAPLEHAPALAGAVLAALGGGLLLALLSLSRPEVVGVPVPPPASSEDRETGRRPIAPGPAVAGQAQSSN